MIFLTSDGFYNNDIKLAFKNLLDGELISKKVAIVALTSYKKSKKFIDKIYDDFGDIGIDRNQIEFANLNAYAAKNLANFDILFLEGGNPYQITAAFKEKGLDKIIKNLHENGKIIIGVSGSALALCPDIELMNEFIPQFNKNYMQDYSALGIIDTYVFPHYGRSDDLFGSFSSIEEKIKNFETRKNKKVLRLRDEDYEVVN